MTVSARQIITEVAEKHGIATDDLKIGRRTNMLSRARWEAMHRMRTETAYGAKSILWIADKFGCHHATIIHGLKRFKQMQGEG